MSARAMPITDEQRSQLELIASSTTLPRRYSIQARALLMASDGIPNEEIARRCGVESDSVRRWRSRFVQQGVAGVGKVAEGRGRKAMLSESVVDEVLRLTRAEAPPNGSPQWSTRSMAAQVGIGKDAVAKIWAEHGLDPRKTGTAVPKSPNAQPGIAEGAPAGSPRQKSAPSQETYDRLVEVATEIFAAQGYEGTSTRDIARQANVALSAINYHFGSKIKLYRAAAEHAASIMIDPLEPKLQNVWNRLADSPTRQMCIDDLTTLLTAVTDVILAPGHESEAAMQLSMRELVVPVPGSGIPNDRIVTPIVSCTTALLKVILGPTENDKTVEIMATSLFGPTTIYRILHNHTLGAMTEAEGAEVRSIVAKVIRRNILALVG